MVLACSPEIPEDRVSVVGFDPVPRLATPSEIILRLSVALILAALRHHPTARR